MHVHSWACRASELKLILVLKGVCIPLYLVKEPFWDSYKKNLTFNLNIFVKNAKLNIKKKKKKKKSRPFFPKFFGSVGKGQRNIFFFLGLMAKWKI